MPQDAKGNEISIGDVVSARFVVRDVIADSQGLNLLVSHLGGHQGLPDDWRLPLESVQCEVDQAQARAAADKRKAQAAAADEPAELAAEATAEPEARSGKASKAIQSEGRHSRA